jgi:hypothetical protein
MRADLVDDASLHIASTRARPTIAGARIVSVSRFA